jgi:hypothetical protein
LPAGATIAISRDNNIAQRNLTILNPGDPATDLFSAVVVGSFGEEGVIGLVIDRSELDRETRVVVRFAENELMDRLIGVARELGLELGHHQDVDVVEIPATEKAFELPLRLAGGEFGAMLVAMPKNGAESKGELHLTQRLGTQELSAGYGLQFAPEVKRKRPSRPRKERQLVTTKA